MGDVATRAYENGSLRAEGFPLAEISDHLAFPSRVLWVDLCDPSPEQLNELARELDIHELAIEDALEPHQRPKLDRYATHLFLTCHATQIDPAEGILIQSDIDAFIAKRWLITVRKHAAFDVIPAIARVERSPDLAVHGVSHFLYVLLDEVVDTYFTTVQTFDEYFDGVSDKIFSEHPLAPSEQRQWFEMRRALLRFHRLVMPMRESVSALLRHEQPIVPPEMHPYFQDVYDHVLRISESSDSLRELVGTIVETNLSLRDYHQNQIVKKVSSWAAIIAVPALITGYFGMNVPYPGSGDEVGVIGSTSLLIGASALLYGLFRRLDWI